MVAESGAVVRGPRGSRIKAVLFDFDDTLIDVSASRQERALRAYRRLQAEGVQVGWYTFWHSINDLDEDGFYRRGMAAAMRDLGLEKTPLGDECEGFWYFRGAEDLLTLAPGCTNVLDVLKVRYRLGVVTNGPGATQRHKFAHTGLEGYFDLFLPSGEAGVQKPDPEIMHIALDRLGVQASEAVFVGDHLDLDVVCALDAGMRAVWYNPYGRPSGYPYIVPDAVVRRLADLPGIIDEIDMVRE